MFRLVLCFGGHACTILSVIAAAAAKSLQSCPTLCNPIDSSPPGSHVPEILQARTLEWVAISFSNACKWKVKVKSLSHVRLERSHGLQPTRLLHPWDFPDKRTGVGCHCLPWYNPWLVSIHSTNFIWEAPTQILAYGICSIVHLPAFVNYMKVLPEIGKQSIRPKQHAATLSQKQT